MKTDILNEIDGMKYLLGYKRGIVISEQTPPVVNQDEDNNIDPKLVAASMSSPAATTPPVSGTQPPAATTPPAATAPATPIKIGVKYPSITELQNSLNTKFKSGLTPDGKYGPKTSASILTALQTLPKVETPDTSTLSPDKDASSEAAKKTAEAGVQNKDGETPKIKSSEAPLANNGGFAETKFDDLYS